jgi:chromosome segregation ATPase
MWASSEPSSPITASHEYNTPENQEADLKSYLMKIIESFKKDINNSLKEIQENTGKKVKELNTVIQDIKVEVETIKKTQMEANLEMENLGKRSEITDVSITNRIKEIEDRISGLEDTIKEIDTTVKENSKHKKLLTQSIQEIQDTMKRPNLRIIGIEENEDSSSKNLKMSSTKIIEENVPILKKKMAIKVQEAYRTPNKWDQKRKSFCHIIAKTLNTQKKKRIEEY